MGIRTIRIESFFVHYVGEIENVSRLVIISSLKKTP